MKGPIEILVYTGKDASFDMYEDAGNGYGYENGEYSIIHMEWNERNGKLEIGEPVSPAGWNAGEREFVIRTI